MGRGWFGNISEVSDVWRVVKGHHRGVDIEISLGEREPPTGLVRVGDHEPVPFAGWLGLLRVLSEVVGSPQPTSRQH